MRYRKLELPGQQTDREGYCRLQNVRTEWPDREMLWVDHPEHAFALLPVEPIKEGEDRKIEVRLSRGGMLRGRVTDWEGKPVPNARIRIFGLAEHPAWPVRAAFTNRRGEYRMDRLAPGMLKIVVDHPEPLFAPEAYTVETRKGEVTTWDVSVRRGGTLVGRVVDRQGRPVKGIEIDISPWTFYQWEVRTDEEGFYRADHLPSGEYRVSVMMPYHLWHRAREEAKTVHIVAGSAAKADLVVENDVVVHVLP